MDDVVNPELVAQLLAVSREYRALATSWRERRAQFLAEAVTQVQAQRSGVYASATDVAGTLLRIRSLPSSEHVAEELMAAHAEANREEKSRLETVRHTLDTLLARLSPSASWRLRYCAEADPEAAGEPIELGGGKVTDANGLSLWNDHCDWCGKEIPNNVREPRERCLETGSVACGECLALRSRFEPSSVDFRNRIVEYDNPLLLRLQISRTNLTEAMCDMFRLYAQRPCFHSVSDNVFFSYSEVFRKAATIANGLREGMRVGIAVSGIHFYLADLASLLAGCTSVGICVPFHSEDILANCDVVFRTPFDLSSVSSDDNSFFSKYVSNFNSIPYTQFVSSGSSGSPKLIVVSRAAFLADLSVPSSWRVMITPSHLPSAWGADRLSVYQTLFNGGKTCFLNPQIPQMFGELSSVRPSHFFAPPAVFEALMRCSDSRLRHCLGNRILAMGSGGAAVSPKIIDRFRRVFRVPFVVG
jgi:hypothetical protein